MPDHKITERHKRWLGYTLKNVVTVVLENSSEEESYQYLDSLLYYYHEAHWDDETGFVLMDTLISVPLQLCEPFQLQELVEFTQAILQRPNLELQAAALRFLQYLSGYSHLFSSLKNTVLAMLSQIQTVQMPVGFRYNLIRIYRQFGADGTGRETAVIRVGRTTGGTELFLENLKVATPWMLKLTNIVFCWK